MICLLFFFGGIEVFLLLDLIDVVDEFRFLFFFDINFGKVLLYVFCIELLDILFFLLNFFDFCFLLLFVFLLSNLIFIDIFFVFFDFFLFDDCIFFFFF